MDLLEKTKEGRNINRHYYELDEIEQEVQRPVVASLIKLLEFRNKEAAFDLDGSINIETPSDHEIVIERSNRDGSRKATAKVDLENLDYQVEVNGKKVNFEETVKA